MECNKDEAVRAKAIAEKKFGLKDMAGAKKFALKAQALHPGLEGISQMLATLDVYISAENRKNGEADWYGVLGLTPLADDDTIRKHYRKLALTLHPDKNKSVGAQGAFALLSEAWSSLSDKTKRATYDQKRTCGSFQQKAGTTSQGQTATPASNGFYNFTKSANPSGRSNKKTRDKNISGSDGAEKSKADSFWTVCNKCKMQYEYLRIYKNHNLVCQNCHVPFVAIETLPPVSKGPKSSMPRNSSHHQKSSHSSKSRKSDMGPDNLYNEDGNKSTNFQWTPFSGSGSASSAAQAANVVRETYEKVKQEREALTAHKKQKAVKRKHLVPERMGGSSDPSTSARKRRASEEPVDGSQSNHSMDRVGVYNATMKPYGPKDLSQIEIREMLMIKAKKAIRNIVREWESNLTMNNANPKGKVLDKTHDEEKRRRNICRRDQRESQPSTSKRNGDGSNYIVQNPLGSEIDKTSEPLSMAVPDPDFYDFDKDRTEMSFEENQVWAAYDDDDGMPRLYAVIHNVICRDPFEVCISWLTSRTTAELSSMDWISSGFTKTCGDFMVGRHETSDSLNSFSHKIWWIKGTQGVIRICPRKGDVWALYRNWSPNWDESTPWDIIHKYDVVEVLEDYDEIVGVAVIPLIKVAGFKTVFHQHMDQTQVRRIPKEEMLQFSHQVPWHLLTGEEAPHTLKGCIELDPAATPSDLLHVVADVIEDSEKEVNVEEEVGSSVKLDGDDKNLKYNHEKERPEVTIDLTKTKVIEILEID